MKPAALEAFSVFGFMEILGILFPHLPIFSRRHTNDVLEDRLEVVGIVVAALDGDGGDGQIRCQQETLSLIDATLDDIGHGGDPSQRLERVRDNMD